MEKKDKQIMEILAQNCRVTHSSMAQALKVSKDTIAYKIHQLEEQGYIKQYMLFVDARKLGFTRYHILLQFNASIENKEEAIRKMANHPFVMWINSFIGRYDIQIIVDAKDSFHLNEIRKNLFNLCDNKVKEYFILTHVFDLEFTQLNPVLDLKTSIHKKDDHSFSSSLTKRNFPVGESFERKEIDITDCSILQALADNPKESLITIGEKVGITRSTVKKKISKLIDDKIILSFGATPNLSKLGFVTYYLLVRLEQEISIEAMKKPFEKLQNIFYAGRMIGNYDMILYLNARTPEELNESINLFKKEIEQYILHYDLLVQDEVHHWRQFTKGVYETLTKK